MQSKLKGKLGYFLGISLFVLFGQTLISTSPASLKYPYNSKDVFCFVGDTGKPTELSRQVRDAMRKDKCSQVFALGDLIYTLGSMKHFDSRFKAFYESTHAKTFITLGNHDHANLSAVKDWKAKALEHRWLEFPNLYYSVNFENKLCFIVIDTELYRSPFKSKVKDKQEKWLEETLRKFDNCNRVFHIAHSPFRSSGSHGNASGKLRQYYEKYNDYFDYIISGHDHNLEYFGFYSIRPATEIGRYSKSKIRIRGPKHFTSGSGSKLRPIRTGGVWGVSRGGYLKMTINKPNGLYFEFKDAHDNKLFDLLN